MVTKIGIVKRKRLTTPASHLKLANICAIVVTFFPDGQLSERLEKIRAQVSKIIISG